jgi:sigma-B regulation protein RsbU (phosphoserine phosphatase)
MCYAVFDMKKHTVTIANSALPYPVRVTGGEVSLIELPGLPLGSFVGAQYDEITLPLHPGDVFVFCSDGVSEAMNERQEEFTQPRLMEVVKDARSQPASIIVQRIVSAVAEHRAGYPPNDDMTVVAIKIAENPA